MTPTTPVPLVKPLAASALAGVPALDEVLREKHRRSFYAFFVDFWHEMEPEEPFVPAEHIRALCDHAQAVVDGRIKDLSIEIGPGYGKSLVMAVALPAWVWGPAGWPGFRMGFSTYEHGLTVRDNNRFRDLIASDKYQRLYGGKFRIAKDNEGYLTNNAKGFRLATSVGGAATGHRVHLWVHDDLLNAKKAMSAAALRDVEDHLRATSSRGVSQAHYRRIVIGQRLAEADAGGLARKRGFEVLCLPTEYDPSRHCETSIGFSDWRTERGELLCPQRFGPAEAHKAKMELGPEGYSAQHQQLPVPAEGGVIKREYLRLYPRGQRPEAWFYFISIDTAQGTDASNDTTAITVWGVFEHGIFLADGWTGREEPAVVLEMLTGNPRKALKGFGEHYSPTATVVEAKDWGKALMSILQADKRWRWPLVPYNPGQMGKDMRANAAQPFFFQGKVWLEDGHPLAEALTAQLIIFPKGKVRDAADSTIQAVLHAQASYTFESAGHSYEGAGASTYDDPYESDDEDR